MAEQLALVVTVVAVLAELATRLLAQPILAVAAVVLSVMVQQQVVQAVQA
jgi:hypothetical protein